MKEPTTISGKPLTFPVAFRLPFGEYQKLKKLAASEKKTVATLVQEWVLKRLAEATQ